MTEYTVKNDAEMEYAGSNAGIYLTTTRWNQSGNIYVDVDGIRTSLGVVYNKYCPKYNGVDLAVTGCSNTADSQIIYYWLEKGYADELNFTVDGTEEFSIKDPAGTVNDVTLNNVDSKYDLLSVSELNTILANKDVVPEYRKNWNGDKTELGNFIAALNFYCGVKNGSTYGGSTGTGTSYSNDYYNGKYSEAFKAAGFDSYWRIGVLSGTVADKIYNYPTDSTYTFTDLGHSILQENLEYGEVIRIGIPGHAIYMDGYLVIDGKVEYHINYGWGNSTATKWYDEAAMEAIQIDYIGIDISPDTNVVVSSDRSDYWGGSFKRGLERINHIQTERRGFGDNGDAVEFKFDDKVKDAVIDIANKVNSGKEVAEITSNCDVEFKNINVNFTTSLHSAFISASAMSFEFADGSIVLTATGGSNNVILQNGNKQVILTLDDSFIYTGNYSSTENTLVDILDDYTWSDLTSDLTTTISGNVVNSGSADDIVTLKGNSALLGNLYLGAGNNVLNVESGSTFYGAYAYNGGNLAVNLTVNAGVEKGSTMLNITEGDENFWNAASKTLNVTVNGLNDNESIILYSGSSIEGVKVNLNFAGETAAIYTNDATIKTEYRLYFGNGEIVLARNVQPAVIGTITQTIQGQVVDGFTNGNVEVQAGFSDNTAKKYYYFSEKGDLDPAAIDSNAWIMFTEDSVTVEKNCFVYFKAENSTGDAVYSANPWHVECIDKDGPSFDGFVFAPAVPTPTNKEYTIKIGTSNSDCVRMEVWAIQGGKRVDCSQEVASTGEMKVAENCKIEVILYDKLGNKSTDSFEINNIDKIAPLAPEIINKPAADAPLIPHLHLDVKYESGAKLWYCFSTDGKNYNNWAEYDKDVLFKENCFVKFKAIDPATNESKETVIELTNIDGKAPVEPVITPSISDKTNKNVELTVQIDMNDDFESFSYTWTAVDENGKEITLSSEPLLKIHLPADGIIKINAEENSTYKFLLKDSVGNTTATVHKVENIDKTAPVTPKVSSITPEFDTQGNVTVKVSFTGDDVAVRQYYWVALSEQKDSFTPADIKEEDWLDYSDGRTFTENGTLYLRSIDDVGNVSAIGEYTINNIDRTAPAAPVIMSDSDGRVSDKPVMVWADFGERKVEVIKYSTDGEKTWSVFDPYKPVILEGHNPEEEFVISLKAVDKAGNVSKTVKVALDDKGMIEEMPVWSWVKDDAVQLQFWNGVSWENYNTADKILCSKNGVLSFRAIDAAGNMSETTDYRINCIDTVVADAVDKTKVFIDSKYTAANTQGKFQDGVLLVWGETAFSSMEEARKKYDFSKQEVKDKVVIVANNLKSEDVDNLDGVKQLSAIQVTPSGSITDHNYSYQSKGKAEKSFSLAGEKYDELEVKWFKDVALSGNSKIKVVDGGNAEYKSRQQYSNDGTSLTRHTSQNESAIGFFTASGKSEVKNVSGFLTVEIADAAIGKLEGGKSLSVEDSKIVKNARQYKSNISAKESAAAAGKAYLKGQTVLGNKGQNNELNVENYKDVEVQSAVIYGLVANSKSDLQKSEALTRSGNKFVRNITVRKDLSTDGSLKVNNSQLGGILGYDKVVLSSSKTGDVSRLNQGGAYRKEKNVWKISQDAKTGVVTGKLTESANYINGGSLIISGTGAESGNISNFSKVTVVGGKVNAIVNNTLLQSEKSFLYNWSSADVYGDQIDYDVKNLNKAEKIDLKLVERWGANGNVLIQDNAVVSGNISGFDRVVVEGDGKGTIKSITAINDRNFGSLTRRMSNTTKNKEGVAASGMLTDTITVKPATSVKLAGYKVDGNINGYKSVAATDASVTGYIAMGDAYTIKETTGYKTKSGITTKTFTTTQTFTSTGTVKLTDSTVAGAVTDYARVELNNSQVGNIANKTDVKIERKYSQTWDALKLQQDPENAMKLDEFMNQGPAINAVLLSSFDKYAANGSVTLKNKSTAGNISGYKTVKLEGRAHDDKNAALVVGEIKAVAGQFWGSYQKNMTNKVNDSLGKSGKQTENITVAPAASVTVFGYDVTGDISGYNSVKLEDVNVAGDIVLGGNYTQKITTVYSTDSTNKLNQTIDRVTTSRQGGTFKAVDVIAKKVNDEMGAVTGYNRVELVNSKVGNIYQSDVTKETSRVILEDGKVIFNEVISKTNKISGSVKLTDSVAGDITNYSSVTLDNSDAGKLTNVNKVTVKGAYNSMDGFVGTDKNDTITIGKGAVLRMGGTMDFGNGKDKITIDGTLVLEDIPPAAANESVNIVAGLENVAGKGIIAADDKLFKDVSVSLINSFGGTLMNLGNTSKGFRGTEFEKADDTKSGAVEWDGIAAYDGWLGTGEDIDCNDAVDFISLVVEEEGSKLNIEFNNWGADDVLKIAGSSQTVTDNKIEYDLKVGTYIIEINRKAENSMSYTMTIA